MDRAYNLGWDAYVRGCGLYSNPYNSSNPSGRNYFGLWQQGYIDAKEEDYSGVEGR